MARRGLAGKTGSDAETLFIESVDLSELEALARFEQGVSHWLEGNTQPARMSWERSITTNTANPALHHRTHLAVFLTSPLPGPGPDLIPPRVERLISSINQHAPAIPSGLVPLQTRAEYTLRSSADLIGTLLDGTNPADEYNPIIEDLFSERIIVDLLLQNTPTAMTPYETVVDAVLFSSAQSILIPYLNRVHTAIILSLPDDQLSATAALHITWQASAYPEPTEPGNTAILLDSVANWERFTEVIETALLTHERYRVADFETHLWANLAPVLADLRWSSPDAFITAARSMAENGQSEYAIHSLLSLAEHDLSEAQSKNLSLALLSTYRENAMYDKIADLSDHLIERFPDDSLFIGEIHYFRAVAFARKGNFAAAASSLAQHIQSTPRSRRTPSLLFFLGTLHLNLGEREEARSAFRRLRSAYPESRYSESAGRFLFQLPEE